MTIIPDTKDWTWVLERRCDECGFTASELAPTDFAGLVRQTAAAWPAVLARPDVRERPNHSTWSPLEYGAHVRDMLRLYRERLTIMLELDDPLYPNWDPDAAAVAGRYGELHPSVVSRELLDAASDIADAFEVLVPEEHRRPARRDDGASFTVKTFAQYFCHDLVHHLHDVSAPSVAEVPVEE
jgi:hypothetical protein